MQLGIEKGLISYNEDRTRSIYLYQNQKKKHINKNIKIYYAYTK